MNHIGNQLENIRKAEGPTEQEVNNHELIKRRMEDRQKENKLKLDQWYEKKKLEQAETPIEKIILRDAKAKLITFEMISINKFTICLNFFMPEELVLILKKHGGAYDFLTREWIVSLNKYKEVAIEISQFCRSKIIDLDPIPQVAFDIIEYRIPFSDESKINIPNYNYANDINFKPSLSQLPSSLYHSLYNFQKVGVQFGVDHFGRILLGDEMGVGKTIQAICIAYLFPQDWPILIVTPASLKFSWRDELLQWVEHIRPDQIQVFQKSTEDFDPNANVYIMSYVIATKLGKVLESRRFQIMICDEAHYLKSRDVSHFSL